MRLKAFAARYGHQPLPVIEAMTLPELLDFVDALNELIEQESAPRG